MVVPPLLRLVLCSMERAAALAFARSVLGLSRSVGPELLINCLLGNATKRSCAWAIGSRNAADPCATLRCVNRHAVDSSKRLRLRLRLRIGKAWRFAWLPGPIPMRPESTPLPQQDNHREQERHEQVSLHARKSHQTQKLSQKRQRRDRSIRGRASAAGTAGGTIASEYSDWDSILGEFDPTDEGGPTRQREKGG